MSQDEFLDTTPRYFDELLKQHRGRQQHGEFMLAQLTATVINFSMGRPDRPVKIADFMLTKLGAQRVPTSKRRNRQQIADEVRAAFGFPVQ